MHILPIPALNAVVTQASKTLKTKTSRCLSLKPLALERYQRHRKHYALKGLGYLPNWSLELINHYLGGHNDKLYPHADAHLRLIIAINKKLKQPLHVNKLKALRQRFATDIVALQASDVWQQASANTDDELKFKTKATISWQDKNIANADGGDMTIRCYQARSNDDSHLNKNNPNNNPDEMVMLFFHGGGFCIGDVNTHHEFCHAICAQTGWAVVSVDYRLAPEHSAPTALRDCLAAYAWLAQHCQPLGASSSRIVLAGDSAGGCLTILVAQQVISPTDNALLNIDDHKTLKESMQNVPAPFAQWPLYPVTDITADYPSWALYGQGLLLDYDDIEVFDAAYMQDSPLTRGHAFISPMYGDNTQMCPSYIVAAELDILRDEAIAYAQQLQGYGIKVQTHTVLGAPHGFVNLMSVHQGLGRETNVIIKAFADFVQVLLAASQTPVTTSVTTD